MKTSLDLRKELTAIDRRSYPAYKSIQGSYDFKDYRLSIDHVQGDPFAAPSKVSVLISGRQAGFPERLYEERMKRVTLQDYLTRIFGKQIEKINFKAKGSGKSGLIGVSRCGQQVLERSACTVDPKNGDILVRMEIGFPANGRTINSGELIKILFDLLPGCVCSSFFYNKLNHDPLEKAVRLCVDQQYIRGKLDEMGLAAFIANGSVLPRESGVSQRPMRQAVVFQSPASMEVTLDLPYHGTVTGMGIKKGITLIVGGGFHGKSTVLEALELGIYNHIPGDGREFVITDQSAVKLRAEDSRSIQQVDISPFINNLPNAKDTVHFDTPDASGSTSQAANTVEAVEAGASLFLIDEDTSATNFMIRDELMQQVVSRDKEPITPFVERVRAVYEQLGISTIMVAGSSGAYFHVADTVIQMEDYLPYDITKTAKEAAGQYAGIRILEEPLVIASFNERRPRPNSALKDNNRIKSKVLGRDSVSLDREVVDLRYVEQLVDQEQLQALVYLLKYGEMKMMNGKRSMREIVDALETLMDQKGLAALADGFYLPDSLARPRRQEIFACFNRYRGLRF
ncbi:MAG: ABC-ATPase domain-containing protein [Clostridiaceae bacterium]|nr:ABC-ATPase domain-containing protein [Clostridiaceae bacterium]